MDSRRFDLLARGVARFGTRRSLLRSLAVAATATAAGASSARALDSTADGVGGTDATGACPPSRRPTKKVTGAPPFPLYLVGGSCNDLDESISYNLIDAGSAEAEGDQQGSSTAIVSVRSLTTVRVLLDDLLSDPHAIVVRAGNTDDSTIACGNVGGILANGAIAFGLQERNGSGFAGTAEIAAVDDQSRVNVLISQDLFELVDSWEGTTVVTIIDVNLRSAPSDNASVITVLAEGTVLTVTGASQGEWLPVEVVDTGETGYVSSTYVDIQ